MKDSTGQMKPSKDEVIQAFVTFIESVDFDDPKAEIHYSARNGGGRNGGGVGAWQGRYYSSNFVFSCGASDISADDYDDYDD